MSRADLQRTATPELLADVRMYDISEGGRQCPAEPGWGCTCVASYDEGMAGWEAIPILGHDSLSAGEKRRLGFVFIAGKIAVDEMLAAGRFYLWEDRCVGEAIVVGPYSRTETAHQDTNLTKS